MFTEHGLCVRQCSLTLPTVLIHLLSRSLLRVPHDLLQGPEGRDLVLRHFVPTHIAQHRIYKNIPVQNMCSRILVPIVTAKTPYPSSSVNREKEQDCLKGSIHPCFSVEIQVSDDMDKHLKIVSSCLPVKCEPSP